MGTRGAGACATITGRATDCSSELREREKAREYGLSWPAASARARNKGSAAAAPCLAYIVVRAMCSGTLCTSCVRMRRAPWGLSLLPLSALCCAART